MEPKTLQITKNGLKSLQTKGDLFSNILDPKQGISLTKFNEKFKDGKANF